MTMDANTLRVQKWTAEARLRNKQRPIRLDVDAVMGDMDDLLEKNARLEEANRSMAASYGATIKGLATQITNAMNALTDARIREQRGILETRLARRIEELAQARDTAQARDVAATKKLAAAEAIIAETHEALNAAKVHMCDGTLLARVGKALAMGTVTPTEGITLSVNTHHSSTFGR